jgi:hypothetical protein
MYNSTDPQNMPTVFLNLGKPKKKPYPATLFVSLLAFQENPKPEITSSPSKSIASPNSTATALVEQKKPTIQQIEEPSAKYPIPLEISNRQGNLHCKILHRW